MEIVAYCAAEFEQVTRRAAGVEPITSPPVHAGNIYPAALSGADFYYIDLHGEPGDDCWYTVDKTGLRIDALTAQQAARIEMVGATVFAANCWLGDEDSPMMDALLEAGASVVIGGRGENQGPRKGPLYGAPLLGLWLRRMMQLGFQSLKALAIAKRLVALSAATSTGAVANANRDALAFRAYSKKRGLQK